MSGLDETLARWRRETEALKPSAALMVELHALAVAQTAAPAAPVVAAKAAGVTKAVLVVVAVAVLGVAGAVLVSLWSPAPAPCDACGSIAAEPTPARASGPTAGEPMVRDPAMLVAVPASPAPGAKVLPTPAAKVPPMPAAKVPPPAEQVPPPAEQVPSAPDLVALPTAEPLSARPVQKPSAVAPTRSTPHPDPLPQGGEGDSKRTPARLVRAVEGLAMTCAAQRNVLVELVREAAADDPEAAAAALTRWTLLCRAISGPALDSHRWFWPWAAPSSAGTACNTVMTDPSCDDGENITQSIAAASRCVLATTPGSCARRGALLQGVFAQCEAFTHRPDVKNRAAVDEVLSRLTAEFGEALAPAAWCLQSAAKAEAQRFR